jgi:flavodoxin
MSTLVVYQSTYGNTKLIAGAVAEGCGPGTALVSVDELTKEKLNGVDRIVVGSPTIAWRYAPGFQKVFAVFAEVPMAGVKAAAFDTGFDKWYAGNAAGQIAKKLDQLGCQLVGKPTRFIVLGKEGPLKSGEIERAKAWAMSLF